MSSLKNRFSKLFDETVYCVTYALDPRFKLAFLDDERLCVRTTADVLNAALALSLRTSTASEAENRPSADADDAVAAGEHPLCAINPRTVLMW